MEVYSLKRVFVILVILLFGVISSIASVPQKVIDDLLKQEKRLSKEAFNAYLSGETIDRYLADMKKINSHIMQMVPNSDIKDIIAYIDMEIDRINYTYDVHSLLRLQQEIDESREYITALSNSN